MKHIAKGQELPELLEFKAKASADWQPSFEGMSGTLKRALHDALMDEQGWLCCYCNCRIDSASSHIEHLRPQSGYPAVELNYGNLLASCQREEQRRAPLHCGKLKADWFIEELFVSPLQSDCETRFRFAADGAIYPAQESDVAAQETREHLGLDLPKLRRLRAGAIDAMLSELPSLSDDDLRHLSSVLSKRDANGRFPEFCVAVAHILRGLVRR